MLGGEPGFYHGWTVEELSGQPGYGWAARRKRILRRRRRTRLTQEVRYYREKNLNEGYIAK